MWAKVEKDTKRGKRKWKMAELFVDERCGEAILEFLRTTDVGRNVPVENAETESSESGAEQECPRASASAGFAGGRAGFTRFAFHLGRPGRAGRTRLANHASSRTGQFSRTTLFFFFFF